MKAVIERWLVAIVFFVTGFVFASFLFYGDDVWARPQYYLDWGWSLNNNKEDCLILWKNEDGKNGGMGYIGDYIFCVENGYKER